MMNEDRHRIATLRYLVPSAVTAMALSSAVASIVLSLSGDVSSAAWWILTATILDRLDGYAARKLNATSTVGMWLDSISDFVAFGVAPAFLILGLNSTEASPAVVAAMAIYILNCGYRLVNFSLGEKDSQFAGVPSTLAGGVFAAGVCTILEYNVAWEHTVVALCIVLSVFGFAMNRHWIHYRKIGGLQSRTLNVILGLLLLGCTACILLRRFPVFVVAVSGTVMLVAPVLTRWDQRRVDLALRRESSGAGDLNRAVKPSA